MNKLSLKLLLLSLLVGSASSLAAADVPVVPPILRGRPVVALVGLPGGAVAPATIVHVPVPGPVRYVPGPVQYVPGPVQYVLVQPAKVVTDIVAAMQHAGQGRDYIRSILLSLSPEQQKEVLKTKHPIMGATALHCAAILGYHDIVAMLHNEFGANVNVQSNIDGHRPLHDAAFYGHIKVVKTLLNCGADKTLQDDNECLPVDIAYTYHDDNPEIINLLSLDDPVVPEDAPGALVPISVAALMASAAVAAPGPEFVAVPAPITPVDPVKLLRENTLAALEVLDATEKAPFQAHILALTENLDRPENRQKRKELSDLLQQPQIEAGILMRTTSPESGLTLLRCALLGGNKRIVEMVHGRGAVIDEATLTFAKEKCKKEMHDVLLEIQATVARRAAEAAVKEAAKTAAELARAAEQAARIEAEARLAAVRIAEPVAAPAPKMPVVAAGKKVDKMPARAGESVAITREDGTGAGYVGVNSGNVCKTSGVKKSKKPGTGSANNDGDDIEKLLADAAKRAGAEAAELATQAVPATAAPDQETRAAKVARLAKETKLKKLEELVEQMSAQAEKWRDFCYEVSCDKEKYTREKQTKKTDEIYTIIDKLDASCYALLKTIAAEDLRAKPRLYQKLLFIAAENFHSTLRRLKANNCFDFDDHYSGKTVAYVVFRGRNPDCCSCMGAALPPLLNVPHSGTGQTPLCEAVFDRNTAVIDFLLSNGADKTCKNRAGQTPAELARSLAATHEEGSAAWKVFTKIAAHLESYRSPDA